MNLISENHLLCTPYVKGSVRNSNELLVYQLISYLIGVRYRELLRITGFNNGTLSYHLETLERNNMIRSLRVKKGNITRYYPYWVSTDTAVMIGYLRSVPARQIMMLLFHEGVTSFSKIASHINKSPSTTSWYLKKLIESGMVMRIKRKTYLEFSLKSPELLSRIITKRNKLVS
ncbi:MAG: winged helix-turn-helix transcriptional regulator [Candidatus Nitrosocosmicus sp.]